jgi:hypothetical protein
LGNSIPSAETTTKSKIFIQKLRLRMSSPTYIKPNVSCRFLSNAKKRQMTNVDELKYKNSQTVLLYETVIEELISQKKYIETQIENLKIDVGCLIKNNTIIDAIGVVTGKYGNIKSDEFINTICAIWGIMPTELFSKNRTPNMVYKRAIMAKLLKLYYPKKTLKNFGDMFDQHHSTIIHLLDGFDWYYQDNSNTLFQETLKPVAHFFLDITKTHKIFEEPSVVANGS